MRVISFNANGLRSAARKGFFDWFAGVDADVLCVQETKAQQAQLDDAVFRPQSYQRAFHDAEKPGYSGVAIYTRRPADRFVHGLDWPEFDAEGRCLRADFGSLSIVSLYLPSGSSGEARQAWKYRVLDGLMSHLQQWLQDGRQWILCGDWNIAHREIDLKNWRSNQKNSGFLPEERAWMDRVLAEGGWVDAYRTLRPQGSDYTWWSNRGQARAKDVGWRIDYQIVSPSLREALCDVQVQREPLFSDHAPLIVDYRL